jgi:hypothetical protein
MKKYVLIGLAAALLMILLSTIVWATIFNVPYTMTYQGYLINASGTPVNVTTPIVFSLYSSNPSRNNPIWTESQPSVPVVNGVYSVILGSVNPLTPDVAPFTINYWLGIQVGSDPQMTPLQALTSTGYAFFAQNAGGIGTKSNVFIGPHSGNTTAASGLSNTAIGWTALENVTTGAYNTAYGQAALNKNTTGGNNSAYGNSALGKNITGNWNTAMGVVALQTNTTGVANTGIGDAALAANSTGNYDTATGNLSLNLNTTGSFNTASGQMALYYNTTGSENTAFGANTGSANLTGSNNTFIGSNANVSIDGLTNATAIGAGAIVTASNSVQIGNGSVTQIGGQVGWTNLSDKRIKKDINDISFGLDFIKALKPVEYKLKKGNDRIDFGFIAQDVETLVGTKYNVLGIGKDAEHTLSLRYTDFIAPMVKAMQEQQALIDQQKTTITTQQNQIKSLEERLSRLESLMSGKQ